MISLEPINVDNKKLTKIVFDGRKDPRKSTLNAKYIKITNAYRNYKSNKYELEKLIPVVGIDENLKKDLEYCYFHAKELDDIKSQIYNNVPTKRDRCLYCSILGAESLDHYVNKAEFPEFSIFTDNLIPCCSNCNSKKKRWKEDNKRLIINNYFDNLIRDDYLFIDVGFNRKKIPFIKSIRLDFTNVVASDEQIELVKNHYKELDLLNRYLDPAISRLSGIVTTQRGVTIRNKDFCIALLEAEIVTLEGKYGFNNWEAAVNKGVLNNEELLDWLSEEI